MLSNLIEQRARLHEEAKNINKDNANGTLEERRAKVTKILADADALTVDINNLKKIEEFEAEQRSASRPPRAEIGGGVVPADEKRAVEVAAFEQYIRKGTITAEQRDLGVGGAAAALVPQGIDNIIHQTLKSTGNYLGSLRQFNTSNGGPLAIPFSDDVANQGVIVGEAVASTELDPGLSGVLTNTSLIDSQIVKVSYELLQDSAWDVQGWLTNILNQRIIRAVSSYVTAGGTNFSSLNTAAVVVKTSASPTALLYSEVLATYAALDQDYVESSSWIMNNSTRVQLMLGTTDSQNRPLIQTAGQDNVFTLFNRPVLVNPNASGIVASGKSVLFGSLENAYTLRIVAGGSSIQRFNELYAATREVGFRMFSRYAGVSTVQASSPSLVALQQHS
jgi:HK97 family phage major capsid protein